MTGNEYQNLARRTQNELFSDDKRTFHAITGLASEVGEVHSLFQHATQEGKPMDRKALQNEIGDILWFVAELCDCYAWSLENIMELNIEKLRARYPEGFDRVRSEKRHELEDIDDWMQ